ncbi:hypothetical protein WJX75_007972 [Coccomyxa subellipsoidea]|uniref:J domain-containing protein n=1 Tax=Coccomyxa subellipsoidea TaxID=248742 RepID=A0ABR2YQV1_9CHLO
MPEPDDAGSQREEEGIDDADLKDAAPDVPPEPSECSRQPSPSRHWSTSSASATTSSSNNSELPANEAEGQATSGNQLPSTWGARNGHVRGGRGKGTEADPVVLSSDSEDEQEDEEQGAKRARTETAPAPGFVKPEILKEPPSLAELLHQYRDQQRLGGQGRPGSLHRPSMPLFESLRRPAPEVSGNGTARSGAPGSAGMRYGLPAWARGQPRVVEFIDLDSSSGDSEGVSWHEDDTADAESELADGAEYSSAQAHEQPTSSEAAHAAAGQEQGSIETPPPVAPAPETNDTSGLVIERDRTATAAVEAEEWELRRVEIERQAEQARREKKRRRAESELALRSQARLEDHRRLLAAQECEADERERLRMEVRAALELRVRFARSAESRLRALHIPMEYDTVTNLPNISKAVRRALLFYHPDRYQNEGLRAQVEAEEMFKLVSRVQNP